MKMKTQRHNLVKNLAKLISNKGLVSRICKVLLQLNKRKTPHLKKKARVFKDILSWKMYKW